MCPQSVTASAVCLGTTFKRSYILEKEISVSFMTIKQVLYLVNTLKVSKHIVHREMHTVCSFFRNSGFK